jgi:hypothetical protein
VLHRSDPLAEEIEQILDAYHEKRQAEWEAAQSIKEEATRRAKRLLLDIVQEHACLSMTEEEVIVESVNGRRYAISMKTGTTYRVGSKKRRFVCVHVSYYYPEDQRLPLADRIIAIALTIAYAPRCINTL